MAMRYNADTTAIRDRLWPLVEEAMDKPAIRKTYKDLVNDFIANRSSSLYDNVPCSRIVCSEIEMDKLFDVLKIKKSVVTDRLYFKIIVEIYDLLYLAFRQLVKYSPKKLSRLTGGADNETFSVLFKLGLGYSRISSVIIKIAL